LEDQRKKRKMPVIDTPKEFLTEPIWNSGFRGIFVGGCIERKEGSSFRAMAHTHCFKSDAYFGWICVRSHKRLFQANGRPSRLLIHEMGHFLTPWGSHTNKTYNKRRLILQKEIESPILL